MVDNAHFPEQREALRQQLAAGVHKTLLHRIVEFVSRSIQTVTRSQVPSPAWLSIFVIMLFPLALPSVTGVFIPEARKLLLGNLAGVFISVFVVESFLQKLFAAFEERILAKIEFPADIADLSEWIKDICLVRRPIFFSILYGILLMTTYAAPLKLVVITASRQTGNILLPILGFVPSALTLFFMLGLSTYYYVYSLMLLFRLSRYHMTLYALDPRSSESIDEIESLFNFYMYGIAVAISVAKAGSFIFAETIMPLQTTVLTIIINVSFLGVLFGVNHFALSKMIKRSKRATLNNIQAQIEALYIQKKTLSMNATEQINTLMDLHARIKATPNAALDISAMFTFLNSVLLPILASALPYAGQLFEFFR